jgi:hypothetical protein
VNTHILVLKSTRVVAIVIKKERRGHVLSLPFDSGGRVVTMLFFFSFFFFSMFLVFFRERHGRARGGGCF